MAMNTNGDGPDGRYFPWGPITKVHRIGEYAIVQFVADQMGSEDNGKTLFSPFIDGRDIHQSFYSLDSALVGAIAYKRSGPNAQAAQYFDLMTLGEIPGEPR